MFFNIKFISCILVCLTLLSCVRPKNSFDQLPAGIWRAVLLLDRDPIIKYGDDRDVVKKFDFDSELPFNFEVVYDESNKFHIVFHNAEERIKVTDIQFGRKTISSKDTLRIDFLAYDTYITAIYEDGILEGEWVVNYKEGSSIPFKAVFGQGHRFVHTDPKSDIKLDGRWATEFDLGSEDQFPGISYFKQDGNVVTGTILTETGDYRYLDGNIIKSKLYLSTFDGAHAFLIQGKMLEDGKIAGSFRSGKNYNVNWEAVKNDTSNLKDPFSLTKNLEEKPLDFSFPNEEGKMISLNDEQYKGKIKLIQIMGTWCPNCMDEIVFLQEYFETQKPQDVAWVSLSFERYKDAQKSLEKLKTYKAKTGITHEILLAGYFDKIEAVKSIPQLDKIVSYPTLLFVDKNNNIVKIHTGFSGPATPEYSHFKEEMLTIIDEIRNK